MFLILISHMFAFFKRLISAKPQCSGGGVSIFFCMRRLAPSILLSPPKISRISSTQKIFYPSLRIYENIRYPPPPPAPGECSRCPSESDKTGVMKIVTKERDIDNDVIVYIVIGDAYQIFRQTLSIKQSWSVQPHISVISVYLYTLTVFHKINLLLRNEHYRSNDPRVTIDHPDQLGSSSFFTS